jgi:copper chaperone
VSTIEKAFTIQGMSCGGCVNSLTRVLKSVPGIEPVNVEVGRAVLRFDPALITADTIKAAVDRAGFSLISET